MNEIFKIFRVDATAAHKIQQSVNDPHHHDFEELIIGREGQLEHFIDFRSKLINAPFVSFVTQGKLHRVQPIVKDGKCDLWVIRFKSEFIAETTFQLYSSFHDNANISFEHNSCFERLITLCELIYQEYQQEAADLAVIRQLLSTLFTIIESDRRKLNLNSEESKKIQSATFKNFLRLLDEHYKEPRDVNFYAEKLFMTVRNLNLTCQTILHQSVSEIIETRKLTEAKNLLITTDKTISAIGFDLGFKEKTYFTHAFKKKTGMTPKEFREEMNKLLP
ncbi:helix-turn-helix transcriptional regulator [Gynurincola endophyticus]|uniref:helix-turn-helix transcriptional regulator n=1 Tax=Gynurincola endophyticus TaxID=2479004 RepID=UPI000F8E21C9|nr:AraC family transcriptional regulator [Gynurincola endophyticus]